MEKWKIVYRSSHGYIEMSPIFYPQEKIRKRKRVRYTNDFKINFLRKANSTANLS